MLRQRQKNPWKKSLGVRIFLSRVSKTWVITPYSKTIDWSLWFMKASVQLSEEKMYVHCNGRAKEGCRCVKEKKALLEDSFHMKTIAYLFSLVAKSPLTLFLPMDCSPPDSSVHGISQARILEWVAISLSRGSSWPRGWTHVSCTRRWVLHHWATREAHSSQYAPVFPIHYKPNPSASQTVAFRRWGWPTSVYWFTERRHF